MKTNAMLKIWNQIVKCLNIFKSKKSKQVIKKQTDLAQVESEIEYKNQSSFSYRSIYPGMKGWNGFYNGNTTAKSHFNKKRNGAKLRRKHRRVSVN